MAQDAESLPRHQEELAKFRDERKTVRFTLLNGEAVEGFVRWFDGATVHVVTAERLEITLFWHAVAQYQAIGTTK